MPMVISPFFLMSATLWADAKGAKAVSAAPRPRAASAARRVVERIMSSLLGLRTETTRNGIGERVSAPAPGARLRSMRAASSDSGQQMTK